MRTIRLLLLPALVCGGMSVSAQDLAEAYNLSNLTVQGTARSMGFGNALGSVGGDFSALSVNPAGIGVYRSSEFTFTPSLRINSASSQYLSTTTNDNNTHFNINNFGLVLTNAPKGERYAHRKWKSVSFAFGMNRTADFNRNYTYQGENRTSSASQVFESDANHYPAEALSYGPSNALGYIGFQSYILDTPGGPTHFISTVPYTGGVNQLKSVQENGGINEFTLSLGGNYKEKLMLGATLGITSINYHRHSYYQESLAPDNTAVNPYGFSYFNYDQQLDVTGGGINLKLGAIYKISDAIRIGFALHSPSYYAMTERYTPAITSSVFHDSVQIALNTTTPNLWDPNTGTYRPALIGNDFDYSLTTPWKGVLSATYIVKNIGFITADYEYVGYNTMHYIYPTGTDMYGNSNQVAQDAINQDIKNTYKGASNFRIGAEAVIAKFFMVRAGFGYYGNPYKSSDFNAQRTDLSAGIGFHFNHFFTDLALVHSTYQVFEQPYSILYGQGSQQYVAGAPATMPSATTDFSINNIAWTIGVKF